MLGVPRRSASPRYVAGQSFCERIRRADPSRGFVKPVRLRRSRPDAKKKTSQKRNVNVIGRRTFLAATGLTATGLAVSGLAPGLSSPAFAGSGVISAQEAYDRLTAGKLILIDIRTPEEWVETGVAPGAWLLDMRAREFGSWIAATVEFNPGHEVAMICRTGNRTGRVMQWLRGNDFDGVMDVSEGMIGGRHGRGWIPSGLPVVPAQEAFDAMPKDLRAA